jgi:hypothetical protein
MDEKLSRQAFIQRFWMRDIADHALFLRKDLTVYQAEAADRALKFHEQFQALDRQAQQGGFDIAGIRPLVVEFIGFSNELLLLQLTQKMVANDYPSFRDHLIKESDYYLRLIGGGSPQVVDNRKMLYEIIFWLRQTSEHSLFIMHWLDPYEFSAVKQSEDFARSFLDLLDKARLFVSMTTSEPVPEIPSPAGTELSPTPPIAAQPVAALLELAKQSLEMAQGYRTHLIAIRPMIQQVATLGVLTTRFVDHQMREAGYFIAILNYMLSGDESAFEREYSQMPFQEEYVNSFL